MPSPSASPSPSPGLVSPQTDRSQLLSSASPPTCSPLASLWSADRPPRLLGVTEWHEATHAHAQHGAPTADAGARGGARNAGGRYDLIVAAMITIGAIGLLLDALIRKVETFDEVKWGYAQRG